MVVSQTLPSQPAVQFAGGAFQGALQSRRDVKRRRTSHKSIHETRQRVGRVACAEFCSINVAVEIMEARCYGRVAPQETPLAPW